MKKLRDFTKAICNHCSYSNSSLEFYETAEWVNFSIESAALFLIVSCKHILSFALSWLSIDIPGGLYGQKSKKNTPTSENRPIIHLYAAGIDVGAEEHGGPADRSLGNSNGLFHRLSAPILCFHRCSRLGATHTPRAVRAARVRLCSSRHREPPPGIGTPETGRPPGSSRLAAVRGEA